MSYEYVFRSNESVSALYERINYVMENILMYEVSFRNDKAVGYRIPWVENSWGADVEVFTSGKSVGLTLVIGNIDEIQRAIEKELCSAGICFSIEEI